MTATTAGALLSERRMVAAGLRAWVDELHVDDQAMAGAAVELVIRTRRGEFADPGWPWVCEGDRLGVFWLDQEAMTRWDAGRPAHPVMALVEALAGGRRVRRLPPLVRKLDAATARLVLSAFDHAAVGGRWSALYTFGGDPHDLVPAAVPVEPLPWPVDELDRYDRPTLVPTVWAPSLRVAGGAR